MNRVKRSLKTLSVFLVVCGILAGGLARPAYGAADNSILSVLPNDTLFVLRVNNFSYSLGQMDQYLAGASPVPMGLSMILNMQLAGLLGDPMLTGIDRSGTFAVAGFLPAGAEGEAPSPVVTFLIPITDFQNYIQSNQNAEELEGGLYKVSSPSSPAGPIIVAQLPNSKFMLVGNGAEPERFRGILSQIKTKKAPLSQAVIAEETRRSSEAPAWLWLNLETGYQFAAPMIEAGINEGLEEMAEQPGTMQSKEMFQGMAKGAQDLLGQLHSLTMTLTPKQDVLLAETWLNAREGTDLAGTLVRRQELKRGFSLAGYLDPQAPMYMLFKLNKPLWAKVNKDFVDMLVTEEANGQAANNEFVTQMTRLIDKSVKIMGSEAVVSFGYGSGQPPFTVTEVVAVEDAKAMRELFAESADLTNQFYEKMGLDAKFSFQTGVETYKDVQIDKAMVQFEMPEDATQEQKAAMEAMYGEKGLEYPFVITDKALFLAMGPNAMGELKSLIDQSKAAGTQQAPADIQTAQKFLANTETADMLMTLDLLELMKGMAGMMQTMQQAAPEQPQGMPNFAAMFEGIPMDSQSAMALALRAEEGKLKFQYALPKQHLMEITNVFMQIQQKIMMQQMQQGEEQQPDEGF